MATISRTGIAGGSLISPTHITNIIDALDGTGIGITVVATGSFSGSLIGNATTATTATTASYVLLAVSSSFATSASFAVSSSSSITALSSSFATLATSASYALKASPTFPYTGSAIISGSLAVTGSTSFLGDVTISGSANTGITLNTSRLDGSVVARPTLIANFADIALSGATGKFVVPLYAATSPVGGTLYWDDANNLLYIYSATNTSWTSVSLAI